MSRLLEMILSRGVNSPEGGADGGAGSAATAGTGSEASGEPAGAGSPDGGGAGGSAEADAAAAAAAQADGAEASAGAKVEGEDGGNQPPAGGEIAPLTAENVKLPDGLTASEETISDLLGVLNDAESAPQERLDNLVGLGQKLVAEAEAARAQQFIDAQAAGRKEIEESAEFGGTKLAESQAVIASVLQEFGSPELNSLIDQSGMGNSIAFYRFLHSVGKLMAEGKPVVGSATSAEKPPLHERMYPNQGKS